MTVQGYVDHCSREAAVGWVIDWDNPASELEVLIVVNGFEAGRCKTDRQRPGLNQALGGGATGTHEFRFEFKPPLNMAEPHTIEVFAAEAQLLLPNGRTMFFPTCRLAPPFTPILITSSGRSGSTLVMQEFARHPDIVISNIYPFEVKLTSYYAALWNVITSPCYLPTPAELEFGDRATQDVVIGRNPWNRPDVLLAAGGDGALRLLTKTFPDRVKHLLRTTIEDYYGSLAGSARSNARLFAEKSLINDPVRQACRILFDQVKEIVLVRDPRDYFCSAQAFWQARPQKLIETMQTELPTLAKIRLSAPADVLFVRYEDLILNGSPTRRGIYDFLGCDADFKPNTIAPDKVPDRHLTSRSAAASIGRYREELDSDSQALCERTFREFMEVFDYK